MAYLQAVHIHMCRALGCHARAAQELRNQYNATVDWFCNRHATKALEALKQREQAGAS